MRRVLLVLIVAVAALALAGAVYQAVATRLDGRAYPPPGELVDVGGYRLHVLCTGEGRPTVILDHLGDGTSAQWAWVQPEVSKTTRVCAYDRAGFGWSDPGPGSRDARSSAEELHVLLGNAGIDGPYVLAGHSFGANVARIYAGEHPQEVAGVVLVDPGLLPGDPRLPSGSYEEVEETSLIFTMRVLTRLGVVRLAGICDGLSEGLPPRQRAEYCTSYDTPRHWATLHAEYEALPATAEQVRVAGRLGDVPLVVLSATVPDDKLRRAWTGINAGLTDKLSSDGVHREVEGAAHASLALKREDARITSEEILHVAEAARTGQPVTPKDTDVGVPAAP